MNQDEALSIVLRALSNLNDELDNAEKIDVNAQTRLFGSDATIDSLSLVSLIVDVEQEASDALGRQISLTDDRAMSQKVSPFTDPTTLADYIVSLANEQN